MSERVKSLQLTGRPSGLSHCPPLSLLPGSTHFIRLLSCHLIALDNNPGVCPIGIEETVRRIIAKAVLWTLKQDILEGVGSIQLCGGQVAGCEAAVHAVQNLFDDESTEAILLVNATNAFDTINCQAALHNIHFNCPAISKISLNFYTESLHSCGLMTPF